MSNWTTAIVLATVACGSHLPAEHPCSEENPAAHAFLASCAMRVEFECAQDPDVPCAVEEECEREWARRCER